MRIVTTNEKGRLGWLVFRSAPQQYAASFFLKSTFTLLRDRPASTIKEEPDSVIGNCYRYDDENKSIYYASDFVPYKPRTDLLLNATAYTPNSDPKPQLRVGFGFDRYFKQLVVFGRRRWKGILRSNPGKPEPFFRMPITYEYAFGGSNHKSNPIGKGRDSREMPNIELSNDLLISPGENLPPAGFGSLCHDWAQRAALVGSYSVAYAKERWPCFPEDFDWAFFNSAPRDQQVDGYARGDEPLFFQNLHPEFTEYRSALPGLRARCFLAEVSTNDQPGSFREVSLNLDTVWIDMDTEKLVLVWRGLTEVRSPKLKEFQSIFVLTEPLSEPARELEHYRTLMQEAIAREEAEFEIEARPPMDEGAIMNKEMAAFDEEIALVEREFAELEAKAVADADEHLVLVRKQVGADAHLLDRALSRPPENSIPPSIVMPHVEAVRAERPDLAAYWEASIQEAGEADNEMAAMDAEAAAFDEAMQEEPALTRESVITAVKLGKDLSGADLSDLDLSGLELSGVDFSAARFKETKLSYCNLAGATLTGASFRKADLSDVNFRGAKLDDTDFSDSNCFAAIFRGVSIGGADFSGLKLANTDFSNSEGEYADFSGADLTNSMFTNANLPRSDFDGCQLVGADFLEAKIPHADFARVNAHGIKMANADITGLRSGEKSIFTEANFEHVQGVGSQWEDCILDRARFSRADLTAALFEASSLEGVVFDRAIAENVNFDDAILRRAILTDANLLRASFERADLTQADCTGSNLYEAAFLDTVIDETDFRHANIKGTLLG